jgi:hypothetical protein
MRPRLALAALAFALTSTLAGCDLGDDPDDPGAALEPAEPFEEGMAKDSEYGAFRVVLTSEDGLEVGENTVFIRLGFHDPDDPLAPGRGIPAADVVLDAWMPYADGAVEDIRGVYFRDGIYAVELDLPEPGVWQLDFELAVGDGVHDSVSFAFVVGE